MTARRSRAVLAASAAVLVALGIAWAVWPADPPRADLRAVAPVPTSSTTTTTTVPTTTVAPSTTATTSPPRPAPAEPTRIRIPALGVDAAVVAVGLEPDRQMEIPPADQVGWYRLGPRPGDGGSAVLAGHVDFDGRPGAFAELGATPVGAEIVLDGATGPQRYVVSAREQVAKADVQLERYFTAEGPARITLITCGGAFSRSVGHYEDNLIITAMPLP